MRVLDLMVKNMVYGLTHRFWVKNVEIKKKNKKILVMATNVCVSPLMGIVVTMKISYNHIYRNRLPKIRCYLSGSIVSFRNFNRHTRHRILYYIYSDVVQYKNPSIHMRFG